MSGANQDMPEPAIPQTGPETTVLMLATFADLYRQEVEAEEDVHRTLPFFGTALGIVIASLAYAAGRLPRWTDLPVDRARAFLWPGLPLPGMPTNFTPYAFGAAVALLLFAVVEAACVLAWISRAVVMRKYKRIGPETNLRDRVAALNDYYDEQGPPDATRDKKLVEDVRQMLLDSYLNATPFNRLVNQQRYKYRARASSHLIRSLIWALAATSVISLADKLGYFPKVTP